VHAAADESGQLHGPSGRDARREFPQHGWGQAHAQRGESIAEHALDLREGSAALAAGQGTQHRLGVPAPLLFHPTADAGTPESRLAAGRRGTGGDPHPTSIIEPTFE
jgi:hypothetical protein